jgi:hypothetical protein
VAITQQIKQEQWPDNLRRDRDQHEYGGDPSQMRNGDDRIIVAADFLCALSYQSLRIAR